MAELKTKATNEDVDSFINSISDDEKKNECFTLIKIMKELSGEEPKIWGNSIVGFGRYHYKYESGREGDWFLTGFSPRKGNLTLYLMSGFEDYGDLLGKLGKYKTGKSCLYVKSLSDIDNSVLKKLIKESIKKINDVYK